MGLIKIFGLAGAALTAWYFLDPKNGADRRDRFSKNAKDLYDSAGKELNRVGKDVSEVVTDTVDRVTKMAEDFTSSRGSASESSAVS
ncbi:MAG: hypothetical protein ABI876_03920 [Bacteroidota bacterium]